RGAGVPALASGGRWGGRRRRGSHRGDRSTQQRDADPDRARLVAGAFAGDAANPGHLKGRPPRGEPGRGGTRPGPGRGRRDRQDCPGAAPLTGEDDDRDEYDALDEALMETFPASDPIAVSASAVLPKPAGGRGGDS